MPGKNFNRWMVRGRMAVMLTAIWHFSFHGAAQPNRFGIPLISSYREVVTGMGDYAGCLTTDGRGVLYAGTLSGEILEFDGVNWRTIPVPGSDAVRSLVTGPDGVVYAAAGASFGYLAPDRWGKLGFVSLDGDARMEGPPQPESGTVRVSEGKIWFFAFPLVFVYDPVTGTMETRETPAGARAVFADGSGMYLADTLRGIMAYEGGTYRALKGSESLIGMGICAWLPFDGGRFLAGTRDQGIFLFDTLTGRRESAFPEPRIRQLLMEGGIREIVPLGENFAVATRTRGVVIIDRQGGAVEVLSETEGLISSLIAGVFADQTQCGTGPLWIVHASGISKAEIHVPLRVFRDADGSGGTVHALAYHGDRLYMGTSGGLFVQVPSPTGTRFLPVSSIQGVPVRKLHLFTPSRRQPLLLASSDQEIWMIDRYGGVTALDDRILLPSGGEDPSGRDTVPSGTGSQTSGTGSQPSGKGSQPSGTGTESTRTGAGGFLLQDPNRPNLIYTGHHEIVGLSWSWRGWTEVMRNPLPGDSQGGVEIDQYGFLWTPAHGGVIRMDLSRLDRPETRTYSVQEGLPENEDLRVFLDPVSKTVLVGTGDGLFRHDYFRNVFFRDTLFNPLLPEGKNRIRSFFRDREGNFWLSFENQFSGATGRVVRDRNGKLEQVPAALLGRLSGVPAGVIAGDQMDGIWLARQADLFHLEKPMIEADKNCFRALIRLVELDNDSLLFQGASAAQLPDGSDAWEPSPGPDAGPKISRRFKWIRFYWAAPFYEEEARITYSYKLSGADGSWSGWSDQTSLELMRLPGGTYTLQVRAMNVYGEIGQPDSFTFRIQRSRFVAVGMGVFSVLLLAGIYSLLAGFIPSFPPLLRGRSRNSGASDQRNIKKR